MDNKFLLAQVTAVLKRVQKDREKRVCRGAFHPIKFTQDRQAHNALYAQNKVSMSVT